MVVADFPSFLASAAATSTTVTATVMTATAKTTTADNALTIQLNSVRRFISTQLELNSTQLKSMILRRHDVIFQF